MMETLGFIAHTIYFYLPSYFANATPVVLGGGPPIDFGRNFLDGRRIFGSHKTIRGVAVGILAGTLIGLIQGRFLTGLLQSIGAMVGDLATSFVKRRINLKPGAPLPVLDQLGFLLGAVGFLWPVSPQPLGMVITILLVTPPIHLATNFVAFLLKLKSEPW